MIKFILFIFFLFFTLTSNSHEHKIIVASTTSTYDTGILKLINENFFKKYNTKVQVLSLGTGQAIRVAKGGNVEVLLVHHKDSELDFMKKGYGVVRHELMYNDFVIIGPKKDNKKCNSVNEKMKEIAKGEKIFISRGDDSGTHKKEIDLWNMINLNQKKFGNWYLKVGQGMGSTLLIANQKKAYTLTDRSTWISFNQKNNLKIVCENFPPLFNQYGLILVNPIINKNLNYDGAINYITWMISDDVKKLVNSFKINGQQLFFYNHH